MSGRRRIIIDGVLARETLQPIRETNTVHFLNRAFYNFD